LIARKHFETKGFQVLSQNAKYFGTEIDLVLGNPDGDFVIVEVKSLKNPSLWHFRLTQKQKMRLLRVHRQWVGRWRRPVELLLALVTEDSEVIEVPIRGNR